MQSLEALIIDMIHSDTFYFDSSSYSSLESLVMEWRTEIIHNMGTHSGNIRIPFSPVPLNWPKLSYGNIDSTCFFSHLELGMWITYLFTGKYNHLWDVGAHHGIDSCVMALMKPNAKISSFEPDPEAFEVLDCVLKSNNLNSRVNIHNVALSYYEGNDSFVRVHGNTTASHLAGVRSHHGDISTYTISLSSYTNYQIPDFAKVNIEGYEKILLPNLTQDFLSKVALCIEVHSKEDRDAIYDTCTENGLNMYTQASGFRRVSSKSNLPCSNKEGYLYLSTSRMECALNKSLLPNI